MKKNLLMALVALMAFALSGNAQNNTYNMVIEMANGTKITIGPNDVKNISFNDGELVMTGEDINTLVERQNEADARIKMIEAQNDENIHMLKLQIADLQAQLDAVDAKIRASIPTIGEDGYWYINGEKTNHYALGRNGVDGMNADMWTIGDDGYWYRNGQKTTYRAVAQDGANVDLSQYATIKHVMQLIENYRKLIPGDAQIINPETSEPYTEGVWDSSAGQWVNEPLTMWEALEKIDENYKSLLEHIKMLEDRVSSLGSK